MGEWKEVYRERNALGGIMQVGDTVEWYDHNGNAELGIVIEIPKEIMSEDRVRVHFIIENKDYLITTDDLEVV